jgi:hypothetical protein
MKKKSPLFKIAKPSDPASMIHKNDAMGELWAAYVDGEPHWIVKLTGLSYTYPVHPEEPESFLVHIVEEAAHRLRDVVTLKIDPGRIKGLEVKAGTPSEGIKPFVEHLDQWYRGKQYWKDDVAWQNHLAR